MATESHHLSRKSLHEPKMDNVFHTRMDIDNSERSYRHEKVIVNTVSRQFGDKENEGCKDGLNGLLDESLRMNET